MTGKQLSLNSLAFLPITLIAMTGSPTATAAGAGGLTGDFEYTVDVLHNADGGLDRGTSLPQNLTAVFEFDVSRWSGIPDSTVTAHILWNDDSTFSDRYVGDTQVVSNIDSIEALRLYEFWYQGALSDSIDLRFGLYDLNSEFDAIDTASLFLNSSHGIGKEYSQTGLNGPSIFPTTSLAARLNWKTGVRSELRYALLDAVPGDPDDPAATRVALGGDDGYLHALEFNYAFSNGSRMGLGGYLYTEEFETLIQPATPPGSGLRRNDNNSGYYLFADTPLLSGSKRQVSAFVRVGMAEPSLNTIRTYIGAGLVTTGLLSQRPEDQLGIAVASARTGDDFRRASGAADAHETTIEITYSAQVNPWLRIQPDIQYVINPGADPSLNNAFVIGVRLQATSQVSFN